MFVFTQILSATYTDLHWNYKHTRYLLLTAFRYPIKLPISYLNLKKLYSIKKLKFHHWKSHFAPSSPAVWSINCNFPLPWWTLRWSAGDSSGWRSNKALLLQFIKHKTDVWLIQNIIISLTAMDMGLQQYPLKAQVKELLFIGVIEIIAFHFLCWLQELPVAILWSDLNVEIISKTWFVKWQFKYYLQPIMP